MTMSSSIGTRLGVYEITSPLGAGGLGEKVNRATYTNLVQHVATIRNQVASVIKV